MQSRLRYHWITTAPMGCLLGLIMSIGSVWAQPAKIDICHYNAKKDSFSLRTINENKLPQHEGHGDVPPGTYYIDADGDTLGDMSASPLTCPGSTEPPFVMNNDDCNDDPDQGGGDIGGPTLLFVDSDGDGLGDPSTGQQACPAPGLVADDTDCNDNDDTILGPIPLYTDADGDGFGNLMSNPIEACPAVGLVEDGTDCDDSDAAINPGATEILDNNVDENCDGVAEYTPTVVFVTSQTYDGNLGGVTGADAKCQALANNVTALQGKTFVAWISDDNVNAKDRIPKEGAYELVNGTKIVDSYHDLIFGGFLDHPISINEQGVQYTETSSRAWTATTNTPSARATVGATCNHWTSNLDSYSAWTGNVLSVGNWSYSNGYPCNNDRYLYCFGR